MPAKYNSANLQEYGHRLAAHLCNQHFNPAPDVTLDGPGVLNFTPVRQINLFVIYQLLQQWQLETSRLRSPYFDFEAPAVQSALTQFQNTLSRHIRVSRATFEPLLVRATTATLCSAIDPASALEFIIGAQAPVFDAASLPQMLRYLDLNKSLFVDFLSTLSNPPTLTKDDVLEQLRRYQAIHSDPQQSLRALLASLHLLLPLIETDFLDAEAADEPALVANQEKSALDSTAIKQPVAPIAPVGEQKSPVPFPVSPEFPLHEKLRSNQPTATRLAATLRAGQFQPAPLLERSVPKIETLRDAISINQRYSFINELFNGENMEYHAAIHHLDALADYTQARGYILDILAPRHDWSRKEEHVAKLLKLTERRFNPG